MPATMSDDTLAMLDDAAAAFARPDARRNRALRGSADGFDRDRWLRGWLEWLSLDGTRQALLPFSVLLVLAVGGGWWLGSTRFCGQVIVDPGVQRPAP